MTRRDDHAAEREEIARIDFFLDQVARAVERGEIPLESYNVLAPRYLTRRAELVALLAPVGFAPGPSAIEAQPVKVASTRPRKPVRWTTVLLFLGAFLVIVASAIFAVVVWDIASPVAKLVFMGALTLAFYAGGYYARTKLELRGGGIALTVVASAMLLFDCWIVIDGFDLTGPIPWAVALLVCSAVYWFSEWRLGDRVYGIIGAAAQIGWWWLLAEGLDLETPVRIAVIALVAVLWELAAERVTDDSSAASLASILLWAAPLTEACAVVALGVNLAVIGTTDAATTLSVAVVGAAGATVALRSPKVGGARTWLAAIAQLPLVAVTIVLPDAPTLWLVGLLATMTAMYALYSLAEAGVPFALLALVSEFFVVDGLGTIYKGSDRLSAVVYAVLACSWIASSRLAEALPDDPESRQWQGARPFAQVASIAGIALLVGSSVMVMFAGEGPALSGANVTGSDVAAAAAILAAWAASAFVSRGRILTIGTSLWSLYVLAALLAWSAPSWHSGTYAVALLALVAVWLWTRRAMERFCGMDAEWFGWLYRAIALLVVVAGTIAELAYYGASVAWPAVGVLVTGAAFFAADAAMAGPLASSVTAGVLGVFAAYFAGVHVAQASTPALGAFAVLAPSLTSSGMVWAAAGSLVLSGVGVALRRWQPDKAAALSIAAAATGSALCLSAPDAYWRFAAALALVSLAWAAATVASQVQWLAGVSGLLAFCSGAGVLRALNPDPWVTAVALSLIAAALCAPAWTQIAGPEGRLRITGLFLAISGLVGAAGLAVVAFPSVAVPVLMDAGRWLNLGWHGEAVVLLVIGALGAALALRWRFEPGIYAACGILLLGILAEFQALQFTTAQLYTSVIAMYLVAMGVVYTRRAPGRVVPLALDIAVVLVGLGQPVSLAFQAPNGPDAFIPTLWAVGLSLVAILAGVLLRVRTYLFAGAAALAFVAVWRTMAYLAEFWWVVLGVIGLAMLIVALTWERQRILLSETQRRLQDGFETWR